MAVREDQFVVTQRVEGIQLDEGIPAEPTQGDVRTANQMKDWFQRAWDADTKYRTAADEDFKFFNSDQWDPADLALLKEDRRPALTINRIKKQVQLIVGFERQNRFDIRVRPRGEEATDSELAQMLTDMVKFVMDTGGVDYELSDAFKEGMIGGRGWLLPSISFQADPTSGEPRFEQASWREVLKDPASHRYDLTDAQYMIRHRWLSRWQLENLYPHKKAQIARASFHADQAESDKPGSQSLFYDSKEKRFRVIETWWRKPRRVTYAYDRTSGRFALFGGTADDRNRIASKFPVQFVDRVVQDIKVTVTLGVGGVVLEDKPTPFTQAPIDRMLPFIPYVADEADGVTRGLVRDLKDPQRETNKRRSQYLHMINTSAVPGWIGDKGAVDNPATFEKTVSRPGFAVWKNTGKALDRVDPARIPVEFFKLDDESRQDMFDIGVNPDLLGVESTAASDRTSGRAILLRQQTGQVVLGAFFDNLRRTRQLLGTWIVALIQQLFTDAKVVRIAGQTGAERLVRLNQVDPDTGQLVNIVQDVQSGESKVLANYRDLRFDVVVSESPSAPTTRLAQLAMLDELIKSGAFQSPGLAEFIMELAGFDPQTRQRVIQSLVPALGAGGPSAPGASQGVPAAPPA